MAAGRDRADRPRSRGLLSAQRQERRLHLRGRRRLSRGLPLRQPTATVPRTGPGPSCQATSPHVAAVLRGPTRERCDPVCQSRCACGRCTVGTTPTCLPAGTQDGAATCATSSPMTARPGSVCLKRLRRQTSAAVTGFAARARQHDDCATGRLLDLTLSELRHPTDLRVCAPPIETCNPVGDTGCGDTGARLLLSARRGATVLRLPRETSTAGDMCGTVQFDAFRVFAACRSAARRPASRPAASAAPTARRRAVRIAAATGHSATAALEASVRRKVGYLRPALPTKPTATLPRFAFLTPRTLPPADKLEGRVAVLDVAFASDGRRRVLRQDDAAVHQRAGRPAGGLGRSPRSRAPRRLRRAIRASS